MKQEDKELLFKDLCGRLPYTIKIAYRCNHIHELRAAHKSDTILVTDIITDECITTSIENVTPYLFPMSSMTEEQKAECFKGTPLEIDKYGDVAAKEDFCGNSMYTDLEIYLEVIEWLNKNHFDYRRLIEKGLAIDCTNLNIY